MRGGKTGVGGVAGEGGEVDHADEGEWVGEEVAEGSAGCGVCYGHRESSGWLLGGDSIVDWVKGESERDPSLALRMTWGEDDHEGDRGKGLHNL